MHTSSLFTLCLVISVASSAAINRKKVEIDTSPGTYAEIHMAQEHHLDNFDIQAFFHLHDLNRDHILDRNEIESIYGVHHEKLKKSAGSVEVHTEQATDIVDQVLAKLDTNGDGVLTMGEFIAGGVDGLPKFKGVEHMGHHYDAEGEYFLHHEEKYHNTPETQRPEDYVHPEDIEHFMSHEKIEDEEEERVKEFAGKDYDQLIVDEGDEGDEDGDSSAENEGSGESGEGQEAPAPGLTSEEKKQRRLEAARQQAVKFTKDAVEASKRGDYDTFARPKDSADKLRKAVPYKFKVKKSWFGEF